jgi:hypothetical protein
MAIAKVNLNAALIDSIKITLSTLNEVMKRFKREGTV